MSDNIQREDHSVIDLQSGYGDIRQPSYAHNRFDFIYFTFY